MFISKHYLRIIMYRTYADLKAEASSGFVSMVWWLLEPILYMGAFYFVFTVMRLRGDENFVAFLLVGLVAWKWFGSTVSSGAISILKAGNLIQQVYLPKYIFPSVVMLQNFFKYLFVLVMLLLFLLFFGEGVTFSWVALPVIILVQLMLTFGVVFLLAAILPFVPDLRLVIGNALMFIFFLSGIIFQIKSVPEHLQGYLYLNPLLGLVESYRLVLLNGVFPDWLLLGNIFLASVVMLLLGMSIMCRYDRIYPKMLTQ